MRDMQLHHVGILMPSEDAAQHFMQVVGLKEERRGYVPEYQALCIFAEGNGGSQVELVIPQGGKLAEYKQGKPVIHHIAFAVDDIAVVQAGYAAQGMPLLDEHPVQGAGDFVVNFLKPRHTGGILVEFVQKTSA